MNYNQYSGLERDCELTKHQWDIFSRWDSNCFFDRKNNVFCVEHIGVGVEQQGWVETNSGKTGSLDQLPNKAVVSRKDVATDWTVVESKIKTNKDKTCPTQVTWKVKFKFQICLLSWLSCLSCRLSSIAHSVTYVGQPKRHRHKDKRDKDKEDWIGLMQRDGSGSEE